ncbi:MAG: mechanosensitive ion channel family protein [Candidatus Methanomethylicia archaeon]|nr:mechanosensitive ion channel family protein [Candidatus Methanomethylicia archaeon]
MFEFIVVDGVTLGSLVVFIVGLAMTFLISWLVNYMLSNRISKIVARSPSLETSYRFIRRVVVVIIITLGAFSATFAAFPSVGAAVASLFVAAGFASIVIGFAAQSTLSNIFAGMTVSISQPIKINDAVMFRNEFCFVEDIRLMFTVLRTWDNRRLMVPNSLIQNEVVVNYTAKDPTMLCPVFVSITYDSDVEKALSIMADVARKHKDCLPIGDLPKAVIMDYDESGIRLRVLSRAKDQPTAFGMARDLLREIKKAFDANGIKISYPRRMIALDPKYDKVIDAIIEASKPRRQRKKDVAEKGTEGANAASSDAPAPQ